MRKRVLVAEASDTNRRVAENLLRQNGFEVISVASADKAREVLEFSRPDLIIVGGDLTGSDQHPLYEQIQSNPKTANLPMLLFEPVEAVDLPFPPEVIFKQPLEPADFIHRVTTFAGVAPDSGSQNPLSALSADDSFLDAALGLDRIDVTDSEVLDRTTMAAKVGQAANSEKLVGYDHVESEDRQSDTARVESVVIRDDKTAKPPVIPLTATGKLEIMQDQYGLSDPAAFRPDPEAQQHDYDWFINSMRDEIAGKPAPAQPASVSMSESGHLRVQHRPKPAEQADALSDSGRTPSTSGVGTKPRTVGVEKFIDEFKKEIERIRSDEPESIFMEEKRSGAAAKSADLSWEESIEKVTPAQVELFTKQLATELAAKIADKIVSKIDPDKLLQLVKAEILAQVKDKHR